MLIKLWGHLRYFLTDFTLYLFIIFFGIPACFFFLLKVYRSTLSDTKKKIFLSSIFSVIIFILIFSFLEGYMRYRFDESDSLGFLKISGRWFQRHVVYNSDFVRDRDFVLEKKQGVTRIGIIGDSMAMGYGIKDVHNRFSNILEKKLQKEGYKAEVYNFGKSGYDTDAEIEEYQKFKKYNFDIIVWEYFLNDAQPPEKSRGTRVLLKEKNQNSIVSFISTYSYLFDYLYWRLVARYDTTFKELRNADMEAYKDTANLEHHKEVITSFLKDLKSENKKVVVIIFPFFVFLPDDPAKDIQNMIENHFKKNGADEVIKLGDSLKGRTAKDTTVSGFDYHANESVQAIAAQVLYDKIKPLLK